MKKITTEYSSSTPRGESFKIIVNEEHLGSEGKQIQLNFMNERWRTKEETIRFLELVIAELSKIKL